jgi:hypothetical protein
VYAGNRRKARVKIRPFEADRVAFVRTPTSARRLRIKAAVTRTRTDMVGARWTGAWKPSSLERC